MNKFKQTWWDDNLEGDMSEFRGWIGDSNAPSKVFIRNYVKTKEYTSIVDLGCGVATEYFGYEEDKYDINYIGVDSCEFLVNGNIKNGVPMIYSDICEIPLPNSSVDVCFSRHVLEHQPDFKDCLAEMIRVAKKEAIHVFFIKPVDGDTKVDYNPNNNLYQNTYSKADIEKCILGYRYKWVDITDNECSLHIFKN